MEDIDLFNYCNIVLRIISQQKRFKMTVLFHLLVDLLMKFYIRYTSCKRYLHWLRFSLTCIVVADLLNVCYL